jgi:hypothetical protein
VFKNEVQGSDPDKQIPPLSLASKRPVLKRKRVAGAFVRARRPKQKQNPAQELGWLLAGQFKGA